MLEYLQSRYMESPINRDNIGNNSWQVFRLRVYKNHEEKEISAKKISLHVYYTLLPEGTSIVSDPYTSRPSYG